MISNLKKQVGASIVHTGRLLTNRINSYFLATGAGITFEQMDVLMLIAVHPEKKIIQKDLAPLVEKNKSGILRTIDILEKKHFVKRTPVLGDRRKNMIEVTEEGIHTARSAIESFAKIEKHLTEKIDKDDLIACNKVLEAIRKKCNPGKHKLC